MIARSFISLACFIALCSAHSLERPGVDVTVQGRHFKVPFFEEGVTSIPEEFKAYDWETYVQMKALMQKALRDVIISRKSPLLMMGLPFRAFSIIKTSEHNKTELAKEGITFKESSRFIPENLKVYQDLKEYSKSAEVAGQDSKFSKLSPVEFVKEYDDYLDQLGEVLKSSPTGAYLDWRSGTIDGVPFSQAFYPYYEYCKTNGFGNALRLIDQAMGLMSKFYG